MKKFVTTIIILSMLLIGCQDKSEIIKGKTYHPNQITVSIGDTIYIKHGYSTAMFLVEKVDMKNRVFIGHQCNTLDLTIRNKRVLSFSEYLEDRAD